MQGSLQDLDVTSLLQLIEARQSTGVLQINKGEKKWWLFFSQGKISYAAGGEPYPLRLHDYLTPYAVQAVPFSVPRSVGLTMPEYAFLGQLMQENELGALQVQTILQAMIEEVLFDTLGLYRGHFTWIKTAALYPPLAPYALTPLMHRVRDQLQAWHRYFPLLQSPDQYFACSSPLPPSLEGLEPWINTPISLRRLCRFCRASFPSMLDTLHQALIHGILHPVLPASPPIVSSPKQPQRIVCIDDSLTVCRAVEYILQGYRYHVTTILNPIRALSLLFQLKPDLILCDIVMPELDGYDLCAMLRKSSVFAEIPIVMLTSKDGFTDRVQAQLVGASDYITKPFGEKELVAAVETYLSI